MTEIVIHQNVRLQSLSIRLATLDRVTNLSFYNPKDHMILVWCSIKIATIVVSSSLQKSNHKLHLTVL